MKNIEVGDRVMAPSLQFGYVEEIDGCNIATVWIDGREWKTHTKFLTYIPQLEFSNIMLGVDKIKCGAMVRDLNGHFHYITRLIDVPKAGWEVNTMICTTNTAVSFYSPIDLVYIG